MTKPDISKRTAAKIVAAIALGYCLASNIRGAKADAKAARAAAQKIMNGLLDMTKELARIEKLTVYDGITDEIDNAVDELEKVVNDVRDLEQTNLRITNIPLDYGPTFSESYWRKPMAD